MRLVNLLRTTIILLSVALTVSCRDEDISLPSPGQEEMYGREYFPLAVGCYWEYNVVEHHWNFNNDSIVRFQTRERIDTVYQGATDDTTYHFVRSIRADSLSVWRDDSAFAFIRTSNMILRSASNVPTIDLLFPIREGKGWNPNLFNSRDSTESHYEEIGAVLSLPTGQQFVRTVRVVNVPQISAVLNIQQESTYAWDVGCVYRRSHKLQYCNTSDTNCQIGTGYIVRGLEREEQIHTWGRL